MKRKIKARVILGTILMVPFLLVNNSASTINTINDQELAISLFDVEPANTLTTGFVEGVANIFTTIYDANGEYRGYRINQIYEKNMPEGNKQAMEVEAKNVCTLAEVVDKNYNYDNQQYEGLDIVCMQKVGNNGSTTVDKSTSTLKLHKGYGVEKGYLVGVYIPSATYESVVGGVVENNVLYITDNAGGSASFNIVSTLNEENTSSKPIFNGAVIMMCIVVSIIIFVLILLIIMLKKRKVQKSKIKNQKSGLDLSNINSIIPEEIKEIVPLTTENDKEEKKETQRKEPKEVLVDIEGAEVVLEVLNANPLTIEQKVQNAKEYNDPKVKRKSIFKLFKSNQMEDVKFSGIKRKPEDINKAKSLSVKESK